MGEMRWAALVVVLGVGCGMAEDPSGPVRLEVDWATVPGYLDAAEVQVALQRAVAYWHACDFDVEMGPGGRVSFAPVTGRGNAEWTANGVVLDSLPQVWITEDRPCDDELDGVSVKRLRLGEMLRHGIGHLLGLKDETNPESFMQRATAVCRNLMYAEACHPIAKPAY